MRKLLLLLLISFFVNAVSHAQHVYKIKTDSLLVTNDSCTAELILENSTKFVNGFLYNKGKGRTEFRNAMIKLTDSTYLFGNDTLNFRSLLSSIGFSGTNIYNANGTVTGDRTVTLGTNRLNFSTDGSFRNTFSGTPFSFQIVDNSGWDLGIMRTGNSGGPPNIIFMKTRGTGGNDDVSLLNNDFLMRIAAVGVNANNLLPGQESLRIFAGAYPTGGVPNFSNGAVPSVHVVPTSFNIATNGVADGLLSRFSIYPDGEIILANMGATPAATSTQITSNRYKLQVFGSASVTGSFLMNTTQGQLAHSSAQFEMVSTTKGFLPPRWTQTQRNAITTPAAGLVGYQTDSTENLYVYKSIGWKKILTEDNLNDATNIYNANGMLTGNRTITTTGYSLKIRTDDGDNQGIKFHRQTLSGLPVYYAISGVDVPDGSTTNFGLAFSNNGNGVLLNAGQAIQFQIAGDTKGMFAYSTGNFLLGTTTDNGTDRLQINGTTQFFDTTQGSLRIGRNFDGTSSSIGLKYNGIHGYSFYLTNGNGAIALRATHGGNVVIGGTPSIDESPYKLDVNGTTRTQILNLNGTLFTNSFNTGTIHISNSGQGNILLSATNNQLGYYGNFKFGANNNHPSAIVEIESTSQGFLPPRMTGAQAEAISSPAEGLMVYATNGNGSVITSKGWWGFNGTTWEKLNN